MRPQKSSNSKDSEKSKRIAYLTQETEKMRSVLNSLYYSSDRQEAQRGAAMMSEYCSHCDELSRLN